MKHKILQLMGIDMQRTKRKSFVVGAAGGVVAAFLLDPTSGRRRRARIKDKGMKAVRIAETRGVGKGHNPDGVVLAERVRGASRFEIRRQHWAPSVRMLTTMTGAGAAGVGLALGGLTGAGLGLGGAALVVRSLANKPLKQLTRFGAGRHAVELQTQIEIAAPVEDVYQLFTNPQNFPMFMSNVKEVRETSPGRYRWTIIGPANLPVSWNSLVTSHIENDTLSWKTDRGSKIRYAGILRFYPTREDGCGVILRLHYDAPAGPIGRVLLKSLGPDPKLLLEQDLLRMKSMIEQGRVPHDAQKTIVIPEVERAGADNSR